MLFSYKVKYYSATKGIEALTRATMWRTPENIVPWETSQTRKATCHMASLI